MNIQSGRGLLVLPLLLWFSNAPAADENFGKNTPDKDKIIEHFKLAPEAAPEDQAGVEPSASGSKLNGIKTRGLNMIDAGKSAPKHKPITHTLEEKAISMEILFDYNSATLTAEAQRQLSPLGSAMASEDLKGLHFRIEGHTDVVGGDQFNIDLSRRRAEAVKEFLTRQYGLTAAAIQIEGKGKYDLADSNNPTSEVNRRVRIVRLVD
jgi:outer membrane protein OmpA-like peptidoglycan-associated protein